MDGVQKEALDKFGQALTEFLQSTYGYFLVTYFTNKLQC